MADSDPRKLIAEASRCANELRGDSHNRPHDGHYATVFSRLADALERALEREAEAEQRADCEHYWLFNADLDHRVCRRCGLEEICDEGSWVRRERPPAPRQR